MSQQIKSIRPFIGAENFKISRSFYTCLGFTESVLSHNMSYFFKESFGFYLQDAYVKDWIDNTMIFLEVDDAEHYHRELAAMDLPGKYACVRLTAVKHEPWGKECFLHDPCGILWHFGEFSK